MKVKENGGLDSPKLKCALRKFCGTGCPEKNAPTLKRYHLLAIEYFFMRFSGKYILSLEFLVAECLDQENSIRTYSVQSKMVQNLKRYHLKIKSYFIFLLLS